jgi:hypothetical protein
MSMSAKRPLGRLAACDAVLVDAQVAVSSCMQRMGRTGRLPGMATLPLPGDLGRGPVQYRRAGRPRSSGFSQPAVPPPEPLHILAQQL